ncbi:disabled homolog 2-interacting protein-like [Glandiceps talaboti]
MAAEAEEREVRDQYEEISREQLQQEVDSLKEKLETANRTIEQFTKQMEMQKNGTKQLIAAWKLRLEEGEQKLAQQTKERDNEMREIISNLMFLEGNLRKEQQTIMKRLNEKDKIIEKQEKRINSLNSANIKLVEALNKIRNSQFNHCNMNGLNGTSVDKNHCGDNVNGLNSTPTPMSRTPSPTTPNRVRFKDDMVDVYEDKSRTVVVKRRTPIPPEAFKHMRANTISYF